MIGSKRHSQYRPQSAYAAEIMKLQPPHVTDWSTIARLKRIGIEPGKSFDYERLDPSVQQALDKAAVDGLKGMYAKLPTFARVVNGWQMNTDTMGVYGDYYLKRAAAALIGLGANQPEDAIYPLNISDANGKPPLGQHNYVQHFSKEELPPANAFWSVTMYDEAGFQVANSINRFAIGDHSDDLKYNPDGHTASESVFESYGCHTSRFGVVLLALFPNWLKGVRRYCS
jgi:hypothetical protein